MKRHVGAAIDARIYQYRCLGQEGYVFISVS